MRLKGRVPALVAFAVGLGLACEPIVGAPAPAAPLNACPAHPCDAYKQPVPAPTCNAGVCTVDAHATNLLLVIGLATDSYLAPGRTYMTTLNSAAPASAMCVPPTCCLLPDCSTESPTPSGGPPVCRLPQWTLDQSEYILAPNAADHQWANWDLGNPGQTAMPVQATFRRLFGSARQDALDLGLPVEPVLANNITLARGFPPGPNNTAQIQFQAYFQPGCYERTLQPFSPFSRAFPPEIKLWPQVRTLDDPPVGIGSFDVTSATGMGPVVPRFDFGRAEGLEGWSAYLRDTQTKRVFSNVVPLTGSLAQGVTLLTNHEPDSAHDALTGLEVVMAPPSGQPLPTEFFAPAGTPPTLELRPGLTYPSLPTPVTMSGRIRTPAGNPVPADIYFSATDITDRTGRKFPPNFEFTTRVSTTRDPTTGESTYSVLLPQGDYQIAVRPTNGSSAVTVPLAPRLVGGEGNEMTGQDFDVTPLVQLSGQALVADGRPLAEAIVEVLPTQCAATVGAAGAPDSSDACLPRPAQTGTANDGSFRLMVDPGGYLLRVRPRDGSRLPWKVSPIVVNSTPVVVGPITIPAPISVGMNLTDLNNNAVPNAVVRVFTDPSQAPPAVELGEAMTDSSGNYEMYIAPPDQ
jgi:hypothetical protein